MENNQNSQHKDVASQGFLSMEEDLQMLPTASMQGEDSYEALANEDASGKIQGASS